MLTASIPATAMRYRDVAAAADWLCAAFGFERQTVLADEAGATVFAQLTFGRAMLMLAPVRDTPISKFMKQPDEIGGAETQSCYLVVPDADAHYERAKAAGAEIILDVEDDDFGGRGYTCRDPQGHIWMFGTYDPWQGRFPEPAAPAASGGVRRLLLAGLTTVVIGAVGAAGWFGGALTQSRAVGSTAQVQVQGAPAPETLAALGASEQAAREARTQLERERAARASADKASEDALKRAAAEQQAREGAERAVKEARAELERERAAKATATPGPEALKRVEEERRAREAAERAVKKAQAELEKAKADKAAAEMAKEFALGRAEEEQLGREAAERAVKEVRAELERKLAAATPGERAVDAQALKSATEAQLALEKAQKRAADEQRGREAAERAVKEAQQAREAAEHTVKEVREQLEREQSAKAAAWRVVSQLTRQLKQVQSSSGQALSGDDDAPAPKKARRRLKQKKAPEPD